MARVWHVYGKTLTKEGDLQGCWSTVAVELRSPQEMPYSMKGVLGEDLPYLASFDHEPTEDEMEILRDAHDLP